MPSRIQYSIPRQLNSARQAIDKSLTNSDIQALVAAYGYTITTMHEGWRLYEAAVNAVLAQTHAAAAQRQATAQLSAAVRPARATYRRLALVARTAFKNDLKRRKQLGVIGATPQGIEAFLAVADTLFEQALRSPEIAAILKSHGYSKAALLEEQAIIHELRRASEAQVAAIKASRQATSDQRGALIALNQWLTAYLKIARKALHGQPHLLTKVGLPVRSPRTPRTPRTLQREAGGGTLIVQPARRAAAHAEAVAV
jgi:hypothetical protein